MINWSMFSVFLFIFVLVTGLGFFAGRWRRGNLARLSEWGLAGRRFGTLLSWFLIGGDLYTAYAFIAIPGIIFGTGTQGFFTVSATIALYPFFALIYPRFWMVARHRGYVTPADFVRERFSSRWLALAIAATGIIAMLPFLALQMYAIEIALSRMGVPTEIALFVAFFLLAAYTYSSGLRAAGLIAIVKDVMIWIFIVAGIIVIVPKLGGFGQIFAAVPPQKILMAPTQYLSFSSLTLGTALGLVLFPYTITGVFSTNSRKVLQKNASLLPAYTILNVLIALFGFMAIAAHIKPSLAYKTNSILPDLFVAMFPGWFSGFTMAAITIAALVPAAIISIAMGNLFTRNIYKAFIRPDSDESEEATVAKLFSLFVKVGALAVILLLPITFATNLQQLAGALIVQTLPAVMIGLYTSWFHRGALLIGWAVGITAALAMAISLHFQAQVFVFHLGSLPLPLFTAIPSLALNLLLVAILTIVFNTLQVPRGSDATSPEDYSPRPTVVKVGPLLPKTHDQPTASNVPVFSTQSNSSRSANITRVL